MSKSDRLKELILYVAQKCADDPTFGATKLNKILYFSDFISYEKYGSPITGVAYMKLDHGPAPKALVPVRKEMERDGDIAVVETPYCGKIQKRILAKREAKLDSFSARDIAMVDHVIDCLGKASAAMVSHLSHNIAWKIAGLKGEIPYESVFLSDREPTDADSAWAITVAKSQGVDV